MHLLELIWLTKMAHEYHFVCMKAIAVPRSMFSNCLPVGRDNSITRWSRLENLLQQCNGWGDPSTQVFIYLFVVITHITRDTVNGNVGCDRCSPFYAQQLQLAEFCGVWVENNKWFWGEICFMDKCHVQLLVWTLSSNRDVQPLEIQ